MICQHCQEWMTPQVNGEPRAVHCPHCGGLQGHRFLPLLLVTGPSGVGKTAVLHELQRLLPAWDVFDIDILWDSGLNWVMVLGNWLRIAQSIAQRPVPNPTILCGTILPERIAACPEHILFREIHWLALLCEPEEHARRLRARPAWRGWTEEQIAEHLRFAEWFRTNAATAFEPPLTLLDTTHVTVEQTATQIHDWAVARWDDA
jgi:hypothetical protein